MRRAVILFATALAVYLGVLVAMYEAPGGLLAAPESLRLLPGGGIGVILLLLLPAWW